MSAVDQAHIRHSLLFLFDSICQDKFPDVANEAKFAQAWINELYGEKTVSESTCKSWFAKFRRGERALEDLPRTGRPVEIDQEALKRLIQEDDTLSVRELASIQNVSHSTVLRHLHQAGLVCG